MKTTKVILISAITTIVILGLFVLLMHTVDGCWSNCQTEENVSYHGKDCEHADKHHKRECAEKKECKNHDAIWAELKVERKAFDEELNDNEKEIIATMKAEFGDKEHAKGDHSCCNGKEECTEECKAACADLDQIVASHQESIDAIMAKIHKKKHTDADVDMDVEVEVEVDIEVETEVDVDVKCKKNIDKHKKMFVRHFLLMDF
ncbi:MAG: hypothetical protein HOA61_13435 [Bacteroidetes bacterium]|nr:hypothetical protein [Bacteroidota bacterium]MBT7996244.1 hypothetical protein [Bacteroidota bacterium]